MPCSPRPMIVILLLALFVPARLWGEPLEHPVALVDNARFTGDLDAMIERRFIRVLTVYGPGRYYLDGGAKGVTAEYATRLEKVINEAYGTGHLKVVVFVLPVARGELFPALTSGRGDIIMAGTTITDERSGEVAFTIPASKPLKEILVTGPSAPPISSLADLSGRSVYLRLSSSYAESVAELNKRLTAQGKAPVTIEPMSELLEDEDLIEMVEDGEMPFTRVIATPEMAPKLGKIAKILGPRGLMPNPKTGTVTFDVAKAIKEIKAGKVEYRVDKTGIIHAPVGKISFGVEKLTDNAKALIDAVQKAKPATAKGTYVKSIYMAATMGPSVTVSTSTLEK